MALNVSLASKETFQANIILKKAFLTIPCTQKNDFEIIKDHHLAGKAVLTCCKGLRVNFASDFQTRT